MINTENTNQKYHINHEKRRNNKEKIVRAVIDKMKKSVFITYMFFKCY